MRIALVLCAAAALGACEKHLVCPPGQTDCGGSCVSLLTDRSNCGACGVTCGPLETCAAGTRVCVPDATSCGGACVDTFIDAANCGACESPCTPETPYCKTDVQGTGCVATCPTGQDACGTSCVDLQSSLRHCGTCGHACAPGEACRAGTCHADALVACYWTSEVVPVSPDLAPAGPSFSTGDAGPQAITILGGFAYAVTGYPAASFVATPLGATVPATVVRLPGSDLSAITSYENLLFVANASVGTIEVLDPSGTILDEIPLPDQASWPNPRSIAFVGSRAYVVLSQPPSIQKVARIDFSNVAACAAPDPGAPACGVGLPACDASRRCVAGACRIRCGEVYGEIDLAVAGATDGAAVPSPEGIAAIGSRVLVPLANVENAEVTCDGFTFTWYLRPAGSGRLAVIDAAANDALSIVDLGPDCKAPSEIAADGTRAWIACGSMCFSDLAPGSFVPVDLSGATPLVGAATSVAPVTGGAIAVCGGHGFVADVRKTGVVVPFDPATGVAGDAVAVCPFDAYSNSLASGIACAE